MYIFIIMSTYFLWGVDHMQNEKKNKRIDLRVSEKQKAKIEKDAEQLGMKISEYLLYLAEHKQVVVISAGKELVEAVYLLNQKLNQYDNYPIFPLQDARDIISNSLTGIAKKMKGRE